MAYGKSPKELVEALYSAIENKDFAGVREVCDPDVDWVQNKGFPNGGRRHGVEEVISNVLQGFGREWESFIFKPDDMFAVGDTVMVLGRYKGKHRATGNKLDAAAAHVFDIKERKIARFRQYADTAEIVRTMQPAE